METHKTKKLTINQEVISNLNEGAMKTIKGGGDSGDICGTLYYITCQGGQCPYATPICPKTSRELPCPDTNILPEGDCFTNDQEICRDSDACTEGAMYC